METTTLTASGDIQAAIDAGKLLATKPFEINGTPALIIPDNHSLELLNDLRDRPLKTSQKTTHTTAKSFVDYFNKFANADSVVFIDQDAATFNAIIDYHGAEEANSGLHSAKFSLKKSKEWGIWLSGDGVKMNQEDFGRFIENNLEEIITPAVNEGEKSTAPSGAQMLEIALSIQAKTETKFSSAQRLDNGQVQLSFHEEINGTAGAKGDLKIPQTFFIGLKIYEGGEPYQLEARLRYRISNGTLTLWYELIRPHKTIEANIADTTAIINNKITSGSIYYGSAV